MDIILISIKTKYVNLIKKGTKKYEYRKSLFKSRNGLILVYSSGIDKKVSGIIYYKDVKVGMPEDIWNETGENGGITREEFFSYYKGRTRAYAIEITKYIEFATPIYLSDNVVRPPQSYIYLDSVRQNKLGLDSSMILKLRAQSSLTMVS